MSEYKIPCELIQDLIPLYVDGLTSDVTNSYMQEHFLVCAVCQKKYEMMNQSIASEEEEMKIEEQKEIDYLKKVKKSNRKKLFIGFISAVLIILIAIFIKVYIFGYETDSYTITNFELDRQNSAAVIEGSFDGTKSVYCRYKIVSQKDGTQKVVIYGCPPSPWHKEKDFQFNIPIDSIKQELKVDDATINYHGILVSPLARNLIEARNPYVGDMPANERIAQLLNIEDSLGSYENELQTDKSPYSWTLKFKSVVTDSHAFDKRMESYASLLMFSIDNLEKVNWTYEEKFPNTIRTHKASITRAECAKFVGELDPKIKSPYFCQELINYLNEAKYPSN